MGWRLSRRQAFSVAFVVVVSRVVGYLFLRTGLARGSFRDTFLVALLPTAIAYTTGLTAVSAVSMHDAITVPEWMHWAVACVRTASVFVDVSMKVVLPYALVILSNEMVLPFVVVAQHVLTSHKVPYSSVFPLAVIVAGVVLGMGPWQLFSGGGVPLWQIAASLGNALLMAASVMTTHLVHESTGVSGATAYTYPTPLVALLSATLLLVLSWVPFAAPLPSMDACGFVGAAGVCMGVPLLWWGGVTEALGSITRYMFIQVGYVATLSVGVLVFGDEIPWYETVGNIVAMAGMLGYGLDAYAHAAGLPPGKRVSDSSHAVWSHQRRTFGRRGPPFVLNWCTPLVVVPFLVAAAVRSLPWTYPDGRVARVEDPL